MRHKRLLTLTIFMTLVLTAVPTVSSAQSSRPFSIGLMGGFGGSSDAEPDTGFSNTGYQLLFKMRTEPQTLFTVRLGELSLDADNTEGPAFDSTLRYLTLGGEYRFPGSFYQSGLYIALGGYDLDGELLIEDEEAFGLAVGVTGDFRITDRLSFVAEFSGHYADLDYAQIFLMGHAGLAFNF